MFIKSERPLSKAKTYIMLNVNHFILVGASVQHFFAFLGGRMDRQVQMVFEVGTPWCRSFLLNRHHITVTEEVAQALL